MLAIRLKRTGRSGHAQFRVIIQDSRAHPKRGKVVAYVGSYDPHTKTAALEHEEISEYLGNGAQPSDRVAKLLKKEGVKLPSWVKVAADKKRPVKNVEKMRHNARMFYQVKIGDECNNGTYVAPTFIEIGEMNELHGEVFGPIVHVIRFYND